MVKKCRSNRMPTHGVPDRDRIPDGSDASSPVPTPPPGALSQAGPADPLTVSSRTTASGACQRPGSAQPVLVRVVMLSEIPNTSPGQLVKTRAGAGVADSGAWAMNSRFVLAVLHRYAARRA